MRQSYFLGLWMLSLAACAGGGGGAPSGTGGSGGAASRDCAGTTCSDTDVCVAYRTLGGGIVEPDAGDCPTGSHPEPAPYADGGMYCVADYAYRCVPLSGCLRGAPINCECAMLNIADTGGTCPSGYSSCTDPAPNTAGLDADAKLICEQLAP